MFLSGMDVLENTFSKMVWSTYFGWTYIRWTLKKGGLNSEKETERKKMGLRRLSVAMEEMKRHSSK